MNRQPKGSVEEIARRTGLSRSTVFRALNNCGSVDECTKAAVMTQAQAIGYIPPRARREGWTSSSLMVGVVMPANPQYFWGEAMRGMRLGAASCPEIHPVFSLYADIGRGRDALYCLEYMENLRPDLLVVTPPADPVFEKKLKALAQELPLVFFNETADAPSRFYAGALRRYGGVRGFWQSTARRCRW